MWKVRRPDVVYVLFVDFWGKRKKRARILTRSSGIGDVSLLSTKLVTLQVPIYVNWARISPCPFIFFFIGSLSCQRPTRRDLRHAARD